jgi:uncharacterized lipoprotein
MTRSLDKLGMTVAGDSAEYGSAFLRYTGAPSTDAMAR